MPNAQDLSEGSQGDLHGHLNEDYASEISFELGRGNVHNMPGQNDFVSVELFALRDSNSSLTIQANSNYGVTNNIVLNGGITYGYFELDTADTVTLIIVTESGSGSGSGSSGGSSGSES